MRGFRHFITSITPLRYRTFEKRVVARLFSKSPRISSSLPYSQESAPGTWTRTYYSMLSCPGCLQSFLILSFHINLDLPRGLFLQLKISTHCYFLFCKMTNKCKINDIICQLIVHLLFIVLNNKRYTMQVLNKMYRSRYLSMFAPTSFVLTCRKV